MEKQGICRTREQFKLKLVASTRIAKALLSRLLQPCANNHISYITVPFIYKRSYLRQEMSEKSHDVFTCSGLMYSRVPTLAVCLSHEPSEGLISSQGVRPCSGSVIAVTRPKSPILIEPSMEKKMFDG